MQACSEGTSPCGPCSAEEASVIMQLFSTARKKAPVSPSTAYEAGINHATRL